MKSIDKVLIFLIVFVATVSGSVFIYRQYFVFNNKEAIVVSTASIGSDIYNAVSAAISDEPIKPTFQRLKNPPKVVKAVYLTSWSASSDRYIEYVLDLIKRTEINAVVIDIKDYSGYVAYDTEIKQVEDYGAEQIRIKDITDLIEMFHNQGVYVIARVVVFQDSLLAVARPDLAIKSLSAENTIWRDKHNLAWVDPASIEAWDYNIAIAREASELGFDEINFDYIRFPTDGDLADMVFPIWDGQTLKREILTQFFMAIRGALPKVKLSVDFFGIAMVAKGEFGVGQVLEDALPYFDYICPMVYPSHYDVGFQGFDNPADHPYEIVNYSLVLARHRITDSEAINQLMSAKIRPWLQDFDLGAQYDETMVKAQIRATYDALGEDFNGFMLWSPSNYYTETAFTSD